MSSQTKFRIGLLLGLMLLVGISRLLGLSPPPPIPPSNPLDNIVQNRLKGTEGGFAIGIVSLYDMEKYYYNENELFPAASLYKLVLMAAVLQEVESARIKLEDRIIVDKAQLISRFGAVDFGYEYAPAKIEYTVANALERVGSISDNFAAIMLTDQLEKVNGSDSDQILARVAAQLEMSQTRFESDIVTTARDMTHFFVLLSQDQIISVWISAQIKELLADSQINDRIPAKLPNAIKEIDQSSDNKKFKFLIHKTGELSRVRHDVGIIYLEGNPYVLTMLSKGLKDENDGVDVLANLSADIYRYFEDQVNKRRAEEAEK